MPILGVDAGGTFTDFFLLDDEGRITVYKRPSTPGDPAQAILDGLREMGVETDELVHGTTVATNAIIERKGARTALITTRGFRDALVIGRQTRPRIYDLSPQREPPLVPDDLRLEANERLDYKGAVLQPLDPAEVEQLLDDLEKAGVESLAICFLFSFVNSGHERIVADAARRRGIPVSSSYEVLPEHREYERTSTTVANAYISPVMTRYLARLNDNLREHGIQRLRVMASNGGSISPEAAGKLAVRTTVSGPAGGVAGAFALAQQADINRIITLDMGGTSTDVALCPGRILERDETLVGEMPIRGPTVDVLSVGAGGGSIARLDAGGALRVGPESAGADPGPACYGTGEEPTVTDAHVVLGRIPPEHFLGGRMTLHPERAFDAIKRIAAPFDDDPHAAAAAILRVANANMESALRIVSVERGYDPRDFTLVAFGGAGPLHACDLADSLRIPRVIVPLYPGVLSAFGMATSPIVKDLSTSILETIDPEQPDAPAVGAQHAAPSHGFDPEQPPLPARPARPGGRPVGEPVEERAEQQRLANAQTQLEQQGREQLTAEGFSLDNLTIQTFLDMRYLGQSYELSVPVDSLDSAHFLPRFHENHRERYGHSSPTRAVEIVNLRLKLILPPPVGAPHAAPSRSAAKKRPAKPNPLTHRDAWFTVDANTDSVDTPIYNREALEPGHELTGPAIIVQMDSTTVIPPAWHTTIDEARNLILEPSAV